MKLQKRSEEVYYIQGDAVLNSNALDWLRDESLRTASGKVRICTHPDEQALLQDMFIAHRRDVAVPIHRHISKDESLTVLDGQAVLLIFAADGSLTATHHMGGKEGCLHCRINRGTYHSLYFVSDVFVFHESTTGPFCREDMETAPFSASTSLAALVGAPK